MKCVVELDWCLVVAASIYFLVCLMMVHSFVVCCFVKMGDLGGACQILKAHSCFGVFSLILLLQNIFVVHAGFCLYAVSDGVAYRWGVSVVEQLVVQCA